MKYKILMKTYEGDLEKEVARHLSLGWQLAGGVTMNKSGDYVQAVVWVE